MGTFGGYTRWAVVFLIIFVLFFLLCPTYGYGYGYAAPHPHTVSMTHYDATAMAATYEVDGGMTPTMPGDGHMYGHMHMYDFDESESSL
jgi:hypothetical protein